MPSTFPNSKAWSAKLRRALVPVESADAHLLISHLGSSSVRAETVQTFVTGTKRPNKEVDPDPLFFALEIFTQVLGPLGGAVSVYRTAIGRKRERRIDRAAIVQELHAADRALTKIDSVYRTLISIFEEADVLTADLAPGTPLVISTQISQELDKLRQESFRAGTSLNKALTSLSAHLDQQESDAAIALSHELHGAFQRSQTASTLADFLADTGEVIQLAHDYISGVGNRYGFQPVTMRTELLQEAIRRLRQRSISEPGRDTQADKS
jgi:hypothetical protein